MQHPIHIHGQRFLVLSVNGVPNETSSGKTRAAADRLCRRRAAGGVESRQVDAALPHRRAHRDRHADGVRGGDAMRMEKRPMLDRCCWLSLCARRWRSRRRPSTSLSPDVRQYVTVPGNVGRADQRARRRRHRRARRVEGQTIVDPERQDHQRQRGRRRRRCPPARGRIDLAGHTVIPGPGRPAQPHVLHDARAQRAAAVLGAAPLPRHRA